MCPFLRRRVKLFFPTLSLITAAGPLQAQGGTTLRTAPVDAGFHAARADSPVRIDGVLDDPVWARAHPIRLPYEVDPGDNIAARVETRCFTAFDETALFFACEALDPDPLGIRAFVTDRDQIESHDRIQFAIDPFHDSRRAFVFSVSALGVQLDGILDQLQGLDLSWDAIWNSAGRITETGFVVEAAIPFKSLRFPQGDGSARSWGAWFERSRPRSQATRIMSMQWDRANSCLVCQAGTLDGLEGITPGRNVELNPTLTSSRVDSRVNTPESGLSRGDVEADAGLDLRVGLTPAVTLNATINPDFSQVEADVAQLNVNQQFALFFPERRPFFLEGSDLFGTQIQTVFTRTIAEPRFGTKVTGKNGGHAYGVLVAQDRITNLLFPGPQGSSSASLAQDAWTVVGRYRRDVGSSSNVGLLYTDREGDQYHNRLGGVDAFVRPFGPLTARMQFVVSQTRYPDSLGQTAGQPAGDFGGSALESQVRYETRNWQGNFFLQSRSPGFRADAGFVPQVGDRTISANFGPTIWASGGTARYFTSLRFRVGGWRDQRWNGDLIVQGVWATFNYSGPSQSSFYLNPNWWTESFDGRDYHIGRHWFGGSLRPSGALSLTLDGNVGSTIDFVNSQPAHILQLVPGMDLKVGRHLALTLNHNMQRLTREGVEVLEAHLSQLRTVYSFNARTFLRLILQYQQIDRNPDQYRSPTTPRTRGLFTSALLSYKVNPLTVLFLGYSDNRAGATELGGTREPFDLTDRSLFLKIGYAWRP